MMCPHKHTLRGKDAPRRYGSYQTEVCKCCGMFRLLTHHLEVQSKWLPQNEYTDYVSDIDDL